MAETATSSAAGPLEPQLIKTSAGSEEGRGNQHAFDHRLSDSLAAPARPRPPETFRSAAERPEPRVEAGNGQAVRIVAPTQLTANGERRTLHLSLGNGSHGSGASPESGSSGNPAGGPFGGERAAPRSDPGLPQGFPPVARQPYGAALDRNGNGNGNGVDGLPPLHRAAAQRPENGAYIDRSLRERVDTDIAAFLAAFDTALDHDTPESRTGLREATDRLLRAGARTRIELERLEARMPLPPHQRPRDNGPAWPQR